MKNLKNLFNSVKYFFLVLSFLSLNLYAQEGSDPLGSSLVKASSTVTNWFIIIATGLFTINLIIFVMCYTTDIDFLKENKKKVTRALMFTIAIFFISQLTQGSIGNSLQRVQTCPLSLMGLHC